MRSTLAGFVLTGAMMATASAQIITFDTSTIGAAPENFEFMRTGKGAPGEWAVVRDETAASGYALEQTSTDRTDYRFPLAIYKPLSARNVDVQIRFKPVAGKIDRAGGIAVRLTGPDDYYITRANALENNVRFYRVVQGRRNELKSSNTKVTPNEWHTLGLRAEGDRFTVSFDGKTLYTVSDKTFAKAGKVALWTKADSVTRFERLEITPLD
jgi:hypothetical protein